MDFMLDIETTGLDPRVNAITSFALVNVHDPEDCIHYRVQNAGTFFPHTNDAATMKWREEHAVDKREKLLITISADEVSETINTYLSAQFSVNKPRLWAKPIVFDWPFLERYYAHYKIKPVVDHRSRMDLRSYIAGVVGFDWIDDFYNYLPKIENAHDALADARWQAMALKHAMELSPKQKKFPAVIDRELV